MNLYDACNELQAIVQHAGMVVDAWRFGTEDDLTDRLTELESELKRIQDDK